MRIAHVVDSMKVGGAEILVSQMCRLQREQGHDPCVYAVTALGPLGERMLNEGFAVQANVARHLPDATRNFFRIFKASRPGVVHLHNPTQTIYAALAARMAGVPSIVSTRHSLVAPPHQRVEELKYRIAALCCDWVVGICDATVNNLKAIRSAPPAKIVRVYNGVAPVRRVAKEDWPAKSGFTLIYVGRLAPVKNLCLLLNAFSVALSSRPDLSLWIVGDGNERGSLERMAQELNIDSQITFWGQQLDVAPFFSAADAFIMSSRSEGLPVSLLEAFSLGLPAIVTDVGGMAEVVRLTNAGITVPPADSAAMAAAILGLVNDPAKRVEFAQCAESWFHSMFSLTKMVETYDQLYQNKMNVPQT